MNLDGNFYMSTDSKKHHFIPRSILRRFHNEEGKLYVLEKQTEKSIIANGAVTSFSSWLNHMSILIIGSYKLVIKNNRVRNILVSSLYHLTLE